MSIFTIGSLCTGVGGLDIGLESVGLGPVLWQVEKDPYCQKVLAKHWPNTKRYSDVFEVGENLERVEIICGGFPCQPLSIAGKRKGTNDDRWLWPEFARIIRTLQPRVFVGENVPGLLSANNGAAFATVLRDLAESGYTVIWFTLQASDIGAPHKRERLFIVAFRPMGNAVCIGQQRAERRQSYPELANGSLFGTMAYSNGTRELASPKIGDITRNWTVNESSENREGSAKSALGRDANGVSGRIHSHRWPAPPGNQFEHEPPRTTVFKEPHRVARVKALGNAVVPQVSAQVGLIVKQILNSLEVTI